MVGWWGGEVTSGLSSMIGPHKKQKSSHQIDRDQRLCVGSPPLLVNIDADRDPRHQNQGGDGDLKARVHGQPMGDDGECEVSLFEGWSRLIFLPEDIVHDAPVAVPV